MAVIHPMLSGFVNNSLYVSPEVIYARLKRIYKNKVIEIGDIIEWCAEVETEHIPELDKMFYFEAEEFIVSNKMIQLPCHLHRLLDVYTDSSTSYSIIEKVGNNGSYLYGFPEGIEDGDTIYLNYIGIAVTEEGYPLVIKTHEVPCMFFCRCRLFEEEMNNGEYPSQLWQMYDQKFTASCVNARQNQIQWKRSDPNQLIKIRGMMIKRLGKTTLRNHLTY